MPKNYEEQTINVKYDEKLKNKKNMIAYVILLHNK